MTVKRRIVLLVAGTGFIASLLFSVVVFYELIEQPFDLLDRKLEEEAHRAFKLIKMRKRESCPVPISAVLHETPPSWLKIYEKGSPNVLYQSKLARLVELPPVEIGSSANASVVIPSDSIHLGQNGKKVPFRIKRFQWSLDGKEIVVQIGLPMLKLKEEIQELVLGLVAGLIFSSFALIVISHFVAGKILKPIGSMRDLAQKISENNLDQRIPVSNDHDEFNDLSITINKMLDRLQYSFIRQRNFLFDTSHELKTPLTTMRLAIDEICTSKDMKNLRSSSQENILRLHGQVMRMERLVKDLLNLSSLETLESIDPKPVPINDLLSFLISEYQYLADAHDITIGVRLPGRLITSGDEEKLSRAFSNVLDNALKYNVDGGRIEVTGDLSGGHGTITIANTGLGVPESEVSKIFEQFYRVEKSRSTQHGGSGLGLAIVKRIIELHKGTVQFESEPGQWTTVTICLPLCM